MEKSVLRCFPKLKSVLDPSKHFGKIGFRAEFPKEFLVRSPCLYKCSEANMYVEQRVYTGSAGGVTRSPQIIVMRDEFGEHVVTESQMPLYELILDCKFEVEYLFFIEALYENQRFKKQVVVCYFVDDGLIETCKQLARTAQAISLAEARAKRAARPFVVPSHHANMSRN